MARLVVLGGGFAGLWAALSAARLKHEIGAEAAGLDIVLVDASPCHVIRVCCYESTLDGVGIPFGDILDPVGIRHVAARVTGIDPVSHTVGLCDAGSAALSYDRLVMALGSHLARPPIPGLAEHGFDVDTLPAARVLSEHLDALGREPRGPAADTAVVLGGGFTGLEAATDLSGRLAERGGRVVLIEPGPHVGAGYSDAARAMIEQALASQLIELLTQTQVARVEPDRIGLADGGTIPTRTVVCCTGMVASPLTADLSPVRDGEGRIPVEPTLRVRGLTDVFAAGDCATMPIDGQRATVMSCQFARPMGRFAGHNAVADLLDRPLLPLATHDYVTVLDLGRWGALHTTGWDRTVLSSGAAAKTVKRTINHERIVPPVAGGAAALLAAAAPVLQPPPAEMAAVIITPTPTPALVAAAMPPITARA